MASVDEHPQDAYRHCTLPDGWRWLRISIPVDTTRPVDPDECAHQAAEAARMQVDLINGGGRAAVRAGELFRAWGNPLTLPSLRPPNCQQEGKP